MNKKFFIPFFILIIIGIILLILGRTSDIFDSFDIQTQTIFTVVYTDLVVLLFLFSFSRRKDWSLLNFLLLVLELMSVSLLVIATFFAFRNPNTNYLLVSSVTLNIIVMIISEKTNKNDNDDE